ncbi:hypothetical protein ACQKM2_30920 [Streptomyces sp. NPDC004126]|uniref:hypothetical protein n=1 Tax=Streptomyces sp. NPDC004126 TaxID=3390695 RepID=UPI003D06D103
MIASTPVARWTWGRDTESTDLTLSCITDLMAAHSILRDHLMASGRAAVHISIPEWGNPKSHLLEVNFSLPIEQHPSQSIEFLYRETQKALHPGLIGSVDARVSGEPDEHAFLLRASADEGFITVELITYSDIWMRHDLRGNAQPDSYAANAPRLSRALQRLAETLDSDTDPEDPTYFGKPTETGVENFYDRDGHASDVWSSFEMPYRKQPFHHAPAFDASYKRTSGGEVQYVAVSNSHGVVLGYVWASDAEAAASFEPRDSAGEEGFKVGYIWLERLNAAYTRGLSPSQALTELTRQPEFDKPRSLDLASLREIASEDLPA